MSSATAPAASLGPLCHSCLHPHGAHSGAGGSCASTPCTCRAYSPWPATVPQFDAPASPPPVIVPPPPVADPRPTKKPVNLSRLAERHLRAHDLVKRLEKKSTRVMKALLAARADAERYEKKIRKLEEEATAELSTTGGDEP